ncbi:MAG: asparagine--tRNA ligase [Treponema sp.]|nr:asparagine--tRNA ligase [Treponema sp.]
MLSKLIREILALQPDSREVEAKGWVRTKRETKNIIFVELNDGSCFSGVQCAFDRTGVSAQALEALASLGTGASARVSGRLVPSPAAGQPVEIAATDIEVYGDAPAEGREAQPEYLGAAPYPLQKKRHSVEFLREIAHLRPRSNVFGAVSRVRSRLALAVHKYFSDLGFVYVNTPIITHADGEGAGNLFQVTTLDLDAGVKAGGDYSRDFFGSKAFLAVTGQLEAEAMASALSRVYTFGPTFRAENSNTSRHLAEFWMIEPEIAFASLEDNMEIAEGFIKALLRAALDDCAEDLAFFDERLEKGLVKTLESVAGAKFARATYTDAVRELEKAAAGGAGFEFQPRWGADLQSEHEKFLTEKVFQGPAIITDYPRDIKAFYMKQNDDGKTVRAMDVLVPKIGEIIGGSQREEDLGKLCARMVELGMDIPAYSWYLDLRRYGTVPHSGFGLGFERFIMYATGVANIRDVIPFPRAAGRSGL